MAGLDGLQPGGNTGESIGAMLSRLRLEHGKSQLRLAEMLCAASGLPTVTRHEVSRWEREERIPTASWLRWLALVLDAPLTDLEAAVARARTGRAMPVPARPLWPDRSAPAVPAAGADEGALRARIGELRRMDDLISGTELVRLVHTELRATLNAVVDRAGPGHGGRSARRTRAQLSLVAELAQLACWVGVDAGAPPSTSSTGRTALRAALAAGNQPLAGHLLGCLAQLPAEAGDPGTAMRLARSATQHAGPASAATRALQWQRVAFAAAVAGERRACEEALLLAERSFARRDPGLDPDYLYWFDEAHLTAMSGCCYSALGRPRLACPLLTAALDSGRLRLRSWAIVAAALARSHAEAGDLDVAAPLAEEALATCVRAGSVRATRCVAAVEPYLFAAARSSTFRSRSAGRRAHPVLRSYAERAATLRPYLPVPAARDAGRSGTGRMDAARPG
jgi:transcriptional regulator with XRE-family HTH domain